MTFTTLDDILSIEFSEIQEGYNHGRRRPLNPEQVFEKSYGILDELTAVNKFKPHFLRNLKILCDSPSAKIYNKIRRRVHRLIDKLPNVIQKRWIPKTDKVKDFGEISRQFTDLYSDLSRDLIVAWNQQLPQIEAKITYLDHTIEKFHVKVHTTFDSKSLWKRPNILYLESNDNNLVFRESRIYDWNDIAKKVQTTHGFPEVLSAKGSKIKSPIRVNATWYKALLNGEVQNPVRDEASRQIVVKVIPEPYLLSALQYMYSEGLPIFTTDYRTIGGSSAFVYYLRSYLPGISDSAVTSRQLGRYLGIIQTLGLMDNVDLTVGDYATGWSNAINIDPDLICWCLQPRYVELQGKLPIINIFSKIARYGQINEARVDDNMKDVIKELKVEEIHNLSIMQALQEVVKDQNFDRKPINLGSTK